MFNLLAWGAVAAFVLGWCLPHLPGPESPPLKPPPGMDPGVRCDTCHYYKWPAACRCVVERRRADEAAERPWSV